MEIKDFWDTECRLGANAVVLVLGEYQKLKATYVNGAYPHIKYERETFNIFLVRALSPSHTG